MKSNQSNVKKAVDTKVVKQSNLHAFLRQANPGAACLQGADTSNIIVARGRGNIRKGTEGVLQDSPEIEEEPALEPAVIAVVRL